jgi:hypothetical protein
MQVFMFGISLIAVLAIFGNAILDHIFSLGYSTARFASGPPMPHPENVEVLGMS